MELLSLARRVRQHHAIEHATLLLLVKRLPGVRAAGHSDLRGFIILGEVPTDVLAATVKEALVRLQVGEHELAVHPNCGTNLVTAGALSGIGAALMISNRERSWWARVPSAILGVTLGLILSPTAGRWMQENVTTDADVRGLRIADVTRLAPAGPVARHRVSIAPEAA